MNAEQQHTTQQAESSSPQGCNLPSTGRGGRIGSLIGGFALGALTVAIAVWMVMPSMMIVTHESEMGLEDTVAAIQQAMDAEGWASPGTINLNKSLAKHGEPFDKQVRVIQLCKAPYAKDVLTTDRYVSCLMPCTISVWEDDAGKVHVSKMNTGLMGKLFGGNIARVMGGKVAAEESRILASVVSE